MAANINPQGTAGSVGRAVPLAFALATIGVLLIAWTFVRLTQRFNHAGSVYGFVGATLGPRAGVISGWALMGTYTFYGVVTSMAAGIFGAEFLDALGIWTNQPGWAPFVVGAIALAGVWALAASNIRGGTRVLLVIEGTTVALILIVSVIILIRLATGTAPNGNTLDFSVFSVPGGTGTSAVFLGVVFGFLSFAGFEAAATLGEEAQEPRRDIPRAILGVAIFGGLYFVFVTAVEVMGFGTDARGRRGFYRVGLAARRPRQPVRRRVGRRAHHHRRRGQRLRLRAGLRSGGHADAVRALARRGRPCSARHRLFEERRPRALHGSRRYRRVRHHHPRAGSRSAWRLSTCSWRRGRSAP